MSFPAAIMGMTASGEFDARPVRAFLPGPRGLELPAGLTVLAGENGSGKSTVDAGRRARVAPQLSQEDYIEPDGRVGAGP